VVKITNSVNLSEKIKLNRSNYETWKWKLENVRMSENFEQYFEKDIVKEVKAKVQDKKATTEGLNEAIGYSKKEYAILANNLTNDVTIKIEYFNFLKYSINAPN